MSDPTKPEIPANGDAAQIQAHGETPDVPAHGETADFRFFSNEYAQAVQAFQTIEKQSSTIAALGASEELRAFIDQFLEMCMRTKAMAQDRGETHFAEWFDELITRAEALRVEIVQQ